MRLSLQKAAQVAVRWRRVQEIRVAKAYVGRKRRGEAPTIALSRSSPKSARLLSAKRAWPKEGLREPQVLYHCCSHIRPDHTLLVAPAFAAQASPAQVFGKLSAVRQDELVAVAEAMPADKYNFAPTNGEFKGVRTFAQQLTHIAEAQYFFFGGFGIKPTIDPKSLEKLTSKDEVVKL